MKFCKLCYVPYCILFTLLKPFKRQFHKILTNCLSVFDHFLGLVLKGLRCCMKIIQSSAY